MDAIEVCGTEAVPTPFNEKVPNLAYGIWFITSPTQTSTFVNPSRTLRQKQNNKQSSDAEFVLFEMWKSAPLTQY